MANTSKDYDLLALCKKAEGEEWNKKPVAYEFSNGKKFLSQSEFAGVYEVITP